jgi:hypothetical protein
MSQDLDFIKQELIHCEEFSSPFDIDINSNVKYITLKNKQEYFYEGGKYIGMTDNKIILQTDKTKLYVPLTQKHPNGSILYKTKLFVVNEDSQELSLKTSQHYESIIQSQQSIIETLTQKIKQFSDKNQELKTKQHKYEEVIRKLIEERKAYK